jgi:hypothetical protein
LSLGASGSTTSQSNTENISTSASTQTVDSFAEHSNLDDCFFDQTTQTDEFLAEIPEFSDYIWDNVQKVATILLDDGDTLKVKRGGKSLNLDC